MTIKTTWLYRYVSVKLYSEKIFEDCIKHLFSFLFQASSSGATTPSELSSSPRRDTTTCVASGARPARDSNQPTSPSRSWTLINGGRLSDSFSVCTLGAISTVQRPCGEMGVFFSGAIFSLTQVLVFEVCQCVEF